MLSPLEYACELHHQKRLPHALIFSGGDPLVMEQAGNLLSAFLLCEHPKLNHACGVCHSCELFKAESHPDFIKLIGEGKTKTIRIDLIRSVTDFLHTTASINTYKVILIIEAQNLNTAASNALLKSLEEPSDNSLLILTTQEEHLLLPTLRSRCQVFHFDPSPFEVPLPALVKILNSENRLDPLALAQTYHEDPLALVNTLYILMQNKIRESLSLDLNLNLNSYSDSNLEKSFEFCDICLKRKRALIQKIPLNSLLFSEDLLIKFLEIYNA